MPTSPPPDVPNLPNAPPAVGDYLRRLSTWAYQEIDKKIPKDEATAHLILFAYDVKNNPKIFQIQVSNSGALEAVEMPLGGGKP